MKKFKWKLYLPWIAFVAISAGLLYMYQHQTTRTSGREITFSELLVQIDEGRVHDVVIAGNEISGHFNDNRTFQTYAPADPNLIQRLQSKRVQITARPSGEGSGNFWLNLLLNLLPLVLFIGLWMMMSRQMNGGMGGGGGPQFSSFGGGGHPFGGGGGGQRRGQGFPPGFSFQ